MPDPALLVFALVVVAVSATLQGTTGFGYNILVVPLLALFIDPKTVIPAVILHNIVIDLAVLVTAWRFVNLRRIWRLLLAGLIGTPIGVLIQGIIDPDPLRLATVPATTAGVTDQNYNLQTGDLSAPLMGRKGKKAISLIPR